MSTATTPPAEPSTLVGQTIGGRYRIDRLLGEGGMGAVYEAEHTLMHKRVAVKVLHAEMSQMSEVVARFEREAMAAAHIEHPNVATATDFGKLDDGSFFLVLEFVEGQSLREAIKKGPFPVSRAVRVARQIASALSRAHGLGIVHRDLKPENVMLVARDGDEDFVKVLDFGIAKVPVGDIAPKSTAGEKALTQVGMIYGTPEYMPPEQALGEAVDRRADLYSLGVMLFEMVAGKRPFDDESKVKLLGMHITAPVPPLPAELQVPAELAALIDKLLSKDPKDRPQEARDTIEAFDLLVTPPPGAVSSGLLPVPSVSRPSLPGTSASMSGQHQVSPTLISFKAQAQTLVSDVRRVVPPKVLIGIGIAVGIFIVIVGLSTIVAIVRGSSSSTSTDGGVELPKPSAKLERELEAAQAELNEAHWDAALVQARNIATENPTRPEPQRILFQAHVGKGDTSGALADASQWLALDPNAQHDAQLTGFVKTAAASKENEAAAFGLLESGKLGASGADMLYEMAYGSSPSSSLASHAKKSLTHGEVTRSATPALQVALDLRAAKDCESKKELLTKAGTVGDARSLAIVESYAKRGGCGFLGMSDCYGCMRKDDTLEKTTTALRSRQ
jgi:serine/threonine-protein kinase